MQQSVSASASPASVRGAEPWWPQGWWKIMDMRIGIIPVPIYVILCALLAGFTYTGDIKGEVSVMIAVLVIGGFTCAEIGKRLPDPAQYRRRRDLRDVRSLRPRLLQGVAAADREVRRRIHEVHQLSLSVHRLHHRRQHSGDGPAGPREGLPEDLRAARHRLDRRRHRRHAGWHTARAWAPHTRSSLSWCRSWRAASAKAQSRSPLAIRKS